MGGRRAASAWRGQGLAAVITVGVLVLSSFGARADKAFENWVQALWAEARVAPFSVSRATFDDAFRGVTPDYTLPDLVVPGRSDARPRGQAEFVRAPQEYLDAAQLARLAEQGRRLAVQHAAALAAIEREIGVERAVVLAIWGRETAFGTHKLQHYAIRVLATQAYVGRRKDLFRTELLWALKMLEDGLVTRGDMRASWAGAMGLTQFMPSEFFVSARRLGGGRPDLFRSVPDALASAAEQLRQKGWVKGLPWGVEVIVPAGADCSYEGPSQARSLRAWVKLGFKPARGQAFVANLLDTEAYLMSPGGAHGPAFLVTENYKVIRRYNMSDLYAVFVGNLADRIAGGGDFSTSWRNIRQLAAGDVEEIQRQLRAKGFEMEKIDGKVGSNTRAQIGAYQRRARIAVDCWPSEPLLKHLKATAN